MKKIWIFFCLLMAVSFSWNLWFPYLHREHPVPHGTLKEKPPHQKKNAGLETYQHPSPPSENKFALVIYGMGLDPLLTQQILNDFPAATTLVFSPYTDELNPLMEKTFNEGHELLLQLPLQTKDGADQGPYMLALAGEQNQENLKTLLEKGSHYIGVFISEPSPVLESENDLKFLLKTFAEMNLLLLDGSETQPPGLAPPLIHPTILLSEKNLQKQLEILEEKFKEKDDVIIVMPAHPFILETIIPWLRLHQKSYVLTPLSSFFK